MNTPTPPRSGAPDPLDLDALNEWARDRLARQGIDAPDPAQAPAQAPAPLDDMSDRELVLAIADELSGIRVALVSALQLACSVPPFAGAVGVTEDGELVKLNREQRRAAK